MCRNIVFLQGESSIIVKIMTTFAYKSNRKRIIYK